MNEQVQIEIDQNTYQTLLKLSRVTPMKGVVREAVDRYEYELYTN